MVSGWFWLWVPMVWPASRSLRTPSGKLRRHPADREEGRLDALRGEDLQDLIAVARQRTVVERQHHLVISERQRFGILHGADPRMLAGIDHQGSRGAERVGMAGTIGGRRRLCGDAGQQSQRQCSTKAVHGRVRSLCEPHRRSLTDHETPSFPIPVCVTDNYTPRHERRLNRWTSASVALGSRNGFASRNRFYWRRGVAGTRWTTR